jgi:beta-glucosidase
MGIKKNLAAMIIVFGFILLTIVPAFGRYSAEKPVYLDPARSIDRRVEDLLSRMTLEEKIGQINMPCVYHKELGDDIKSKMDGCKKLAEGIYEEEIGPCGGFFTLAHIILKEGPIQQAEYFNELQKIAIEKTRLGIPLIQFEEGTHGLRCSGATVFPEGLSIGSTWNMDMVKKIYSAAAKEARAVGIHSLFTLVIEPNRDPRMGRNEEGYSEDPYLCSRISESIVIGAQGDDISAEDKVVAGLSHYPGQSQGIGGLERGSMDISERILREYFLPPWISGIRDAGALGVMATYPSIDGKPVHSSEKILTKILREEIGFKGLLLSEGSGITTLVDERIVKTQKEAGAVALMAGVDVGISYEPAYMRCMIENVKEGIVNIRTIDRSVRRILRLKFQLGLFENPYVEPDYAKIVFNSNEHQKLALQAAREGIVLLKNEGNILPLDKNIKTIAVIGPNADNGRNQLGDYSPKPVLHHLVTLLDGIRNKVSENTRVVYVKGCDVLHTGYNEISKAQKAAQEADVAVVVVGENESKAPNNGGTNGEGLDIANLNLTGLQDKLIKAVHESGTPTIVILINGRPLTIPWTAEHVPAIIESWNCGEKGGHAVADVLFGDYNPSGRLAITIPRHVGQLPMYYNYYPSKVHRLRRGYVDMNAEPLYEFGYGLSYTEYKYSNLQINPRETGSAGEVRISVDVQNIGNREGSEVVQLYINDVISSIVTPIIELKGFEKVFLKPGEKKSIVFTLTPEQMSFINDNMKPVVEPGAFDVMVGSSCKNIRLKGSFKVKN